MDQFDEMWELVINMHPLHFWGIRLYPCMDHFSSIPTVPHTGFHPPKLSALIFFLPR